MAAAESSLKTEHASPDGLHEGEMGRNLQGKCAALVSPVMPIKLYLFCLLITVLIVAVVGLVVALSVRKPEQAITNHTYYSTCPRKWIGYGNKCYYFSEDTRNWTHCQNSCRALGAELTQFESLEELDFLRRCMGPSDHWIGLQRESSQHAWKWTDNTEVSIRGVGERAYLNVNGISSARKHIDRKWICSKPNTYILQCQIPAMHCNLLSTVVNSKLLSKLSNCGNGEMAQWLGVLAALSDKLGSVPGTHMATTGHP